MHKRDRRSNLRTILLLPLANKFNFDKEFQSTDKQKVWPKKTENNRRIRLDINIWSECKNTGHKYLEIQICESRESNLKVEKTNEEEARNLLEK